MSALSDEIPNQIRSLRRSATLPPKLNPSKQRDFSDSSDEVLFYHPSAKIVHFSPRAVVPIPSSSAPADFDYPVDTIETLPWRSATERTVALAPLRLEKLQGLMVFLKCGSVVHAILKNSQCWCVDSESTFVLRIRPLTYYRIELPFDTEEDRNSVTQLKTVLPTALRYEITPCPFKRGFTVKLPEEAVVPKKKRAWRPRERRESAPVYPSFIPELKFDRKEEVLDRPKTAGGTSGNAANLGILRKPKTGSKSPLETIQDDAEPAAPVDTPKDVKRLESATTEEHHEDFKIQAEMLDPKRETKADPDPLLMLSTEYRPSSQLPPSPPMSSPYTECGDYKSLECREGGHNALQLGQNEDSPEVEVSQGAIPEAAKEPTERREDHSELIKATTNTEQDSESSVTPEYTDEPHVSHPCRSEYPPKMTISQDSAPPTKKEPFAEAKNEDSFAAPEVSPNLAVPAQESSGLFDTGRESPVRQSSPTFAAATEPMPGSLLRIPSSPDTFYSARKDHSTSPGSNRSSMTREFRRRSKESRTRELSPMPPTSTLTHQRGRSAKKATASFFHKTCTLVLVPPVQLFLVLIHMAAQIVIKPDGSAAHPDHEDDFGVPIAPERRNSERVEKHTD